MDLKDFVKESIVQIATGVKDAYSGDSDHRFWFYSIIRSSQRNELIVSL